MNTSELQDEEIDLSEIWSYLIDGKWVIAFSTILFLCLAATLAFVMTPKYEAKVIAIYAKDEGRTGGLASQFGGLAEMAGLSLGGGNDKEAAIAFMQSRAFLEKFIEKEGIMEALFADKWDVENKKWKITDPEKIPTLFQAYTRFSRNILNINSDKKTGLITISITWKDREQGAYWANTLIKRTNELLRENTINDTQLSLDYLQKELQKTSLVDVQNTIYRIMESQIKTMMMANTQEQFAFKIIDPAISVDKESFISPKRPLIITMGALLGLLLGSSIAVIKKVIDSKKNRSSTQKF